MELFIDRLFLKGMVSFGLTLTWAALCYPFLRKQGKPWYFLVFGAFLVPTGVFVFRELLEIEYPSSGNYLDMLAFGIGNFLALVLVWFLFWRKQRALAASPVSMVPSVQFGITERLRLRHFFQIAMELEEEGRVFYERLAKRTQHAEIRDLASQLAREELIHKTLLSDFFSRWLPVKMSRSMLARLLQTHKISGPFFQHFPHNTPERHLIILAYQQELRFADFYRCFAESFPDVWQKMRLQGLIQQEIQHAEQLKRLADRLELEQSRGN